MKFLYLVLFAVLLSACSKDDVYGPNRLKNGEEVELQVDHRYAAINETLLLLPQKAEADASLYGFTNRKPGYIYRVKARFHVEPEPLQDGPDRWFDFTQVLSEEKYQGSEAFDIALIQSPVPGGPLITLMKENDVYVYVPGKLQLTYSSDLVKDQLEEIWQNARSVRDSYQPGSQQLLTPKWKAIRATVIHDPANFGKAYLVQHIEFTL